MGGPEASPYNCTGLQSSQLQDGDSDLYSIQDRVVRRNEMTYSVMSVTQQTVNTD